MARTRAGPDRARRGQAPRRAPSERGPLGRGAPQSRGRSLRANRLRAGGHDSSIRRALCTGGGIRDLPGVPHPTLTPEARGLVCYRGRLSYMTLIIATRIEEARRGRGEDRIAVVELPGRKLVVVADGAGGVTGGADAAEAICRAPTGDVADWTTWLAQQDAALAAKSTGLAAAVVFSISDDGIIRGASVGDCEAWVFGPDEAVNLTEDQIRKPLLGDGGAVPVGFASRLSNGTLIAASDGLWKYMQRARIAEAAKIRPLESAVAALFDGVRLRSGALQDDVAIAVCRMDRA